MEHPIHRVLGFEIVGRYVLKAEFGDGTAQTVDLEPMLAGALYGPLRNPELFRVDKALFAGDA